jgi:hypothetical protein
MTDEQTPGLTRRDFLKTTAGTTAGAMLAGLTPLARRLWIPPVASSARTTASISVWSA